MNMIDEITRAWIRNEADEKAAYAGARFDPERAAWPVYWIESYCHLYEGEYAGQPLILRGAHVFPGWELPIAAAWDAGGREESIRRLHAYSEAFRAGRPYDWQYEILARLFGWVQFSEHWQRMVRRFRKGSVWVPKKSKKSPTLAALGLYLLCGDGEQGQKVFLAAKDGTQARQIVGQHAVEMVLSSPELSGECKINNTMQRISYAATRSYLQPLSSADTRAMQAKEGINGSVLIDETHVVDREFAVRISRAGISRSEPLFLQFSTAGLDGDCYGKEEFDYGRAVESGRFTDPHYLFAAWAAPDDLSDDRLADDPLKYIRAANPAMGPGGTIDEAEILADYHASRVSVTRLADFKTYRLDLWQRAASPWLRTSDWKACRRAFTVEDMRGRPCAAGLDLGRTDDMTALVLAFPVDSDNETDMGSRGEEQDQPCRLLSYFWLPEAAVKKYGSEVPYAQWVRDGHLRTTPGEAIDIQFLQAEIAEILRQFEVAAFAFHPYYATSLVAWLADQEGFPQETFFAFPQTIKFFAGPTAKLERLIIGHKLEHDDNPIMNWQAGHVMVRHDVNQNLRPVKPPRNERKKIDGIVAAIMALDAADRTGMFSAGTSDGMVWYLDSEEEIEQQEESGLSVEEWDRQQAGRGESDEALYS